MGNSRKDMERTMRQVLRLIDKENSVASLSDAQRIALKECAAFGYVEGVSVETMISGRIVVEESNHLVTFSGLKFLYPYKDWKFIIPTAISVFDLILIAVTNLRG